MTSAELISWLKSESAIRCVLMEVGVQSGGTEITRYLSNKGYVTKPTDTPANTVYTAAISGGVRFTESLSLEGEPSLSYGDIEIINSGGGKDSWLTDVWTNRSIQIYIGDPNWPRSDFYKIFDGVVASINSRSRDKINLKISDKLQRLNTPISEVALGGTSSLKDSLIPLCFGECHNVTPLVSDAANHEYQVHNGAIEDILEVRDNGIPVNFTKYLSTGKFRLNQSPVGTITCSVQGAQLPQNLGNELISNGTFDSNIVGWSGGGSLSWSNGRIKVDMTDSQGYAYQAIPTVVGKKYRITAIETFGSANQTINGSGTSNIWFGSAVGVNDMGEVGWNSGDRNMDAVFTAKSTTTYIHLWASYGVMYYDNVSVKEQVYAAGYTNNTTTLIKHIVTSYGSTLNRFTPADLDTASLNSFESANTQAVGIYLSDRANVLEVCNNLAKSVGARVAMNRSGQMYLVKLDLQNLASSGIIDASFMVDKSLQVSDLPAVKAAVQIGYCKNYTVQTGLTTGLPEAHIALYAEEWLTATSSDATVASVYRINTEPTREETQLLTEADASAEATRRLNMFKVQRKVMRFEGFGDLLLETLGSGKTLTHSRFGLSAGVLGQIISLETDWLNPHTTVEILI